MLIIPAAESAAWKTPQVFRMFSEVSGITGANPDLDTTNITRTFTPQYPTAHVGALVDSRFVVVVVGFKRNIGTGATSVTSVACAGTSLTHVVDQRNNNVGTHVFYGNIPSKGATMDVTTTIVKNTGGTGTSVVAWLFDNYGLADYVGSLISSGNNPSVSGEVFGTPTHKKSLAIMACTKRTSGWSPIFSAAPLVTNGWLMVDRTTPSGSSYGVAEGLFQKWKDAHLGRGTPEIPNYPYLGASLGDMTLVSGFCVADNIRYATSWTGGFSSAGDTLSLNLQWGETGNAGADTLSLFTLTT